MLCNDSLYGILKSTSTCPWVDTERAFHLCFAYLLDREDIFLGPDHALFPQCDNRSYLVIVHRSFSNDPFSHSLDNKCMCIQLMYIRVIPAWVQKVWGVFWKVHVVNPRMMCLPLFHEQNEKFLIVFTPHGLYHMILTCGCELDELYHNHFK